ncbi:hypothetical protein Bbelb_440570 [Branchiostoma belcheri]|nr:hypothetical protein Bbelb_440570 [Branchiostoma belcheri]
MTSKKTPNIVITSFIRVDGERQARYAAEETFRKVQAEYNELRGIIDDINGQIDASRERLRLIKYEHNETHPDQESVQSDGSMTRSAQWSRSLDRNKNTWIRLGLRSYQLSDVFLIWSSLGLEGRVKCREEKRHLQSRLGDDAGSDRSGGSYTHYSRDLYSYRRRDTHSREHHDYDSSANKRRASRDTAWFADRLFEMMASVEMEVSELQRVRREIVRQQELVRTLHIDIHTLQFREDELRKVTNEADKRHSREVDLRDNVVTKLQAEIQGPPGDPSPAIGDDEETTMGTSGRRPLGEYCAPLPAPTPMPTGRTWGALTKMDTTPVPGFAPPAKRDYGTARIGTTTSRISYVTSAAARKTTSRPLTEQDDAPGGKFAKIEVRGQTTRKDTTPTLSANKTIRIGPPKNPGESGFIHQVDRTEQDQVDTSSVVTMKISGQGQSFSGQGIDSQQAGVYGQVTSLTPQVGQQERIMVTVTEGKVTGAKQLKSGQATELSLHETQQILASVPTEAAQQSGNIMVTVTEGKVIETKTVTEKEAETIVSLVTEQADPTAEKVVVSLEGGQVAGKRIGKDKDTALSPEEAAQLWRSVAQPGQQTGDVVVSLSQGQIVGSQQLTPTEAETIKAVVVEEARPTVCPTPVQPTFVSIAQTTAQVAALQEDKIMVTVTDGKVTGAKRLKSGDTKELSPIETQQIMASVPADTSQQSGNIMVTITEGKVIETKQVTTKEAETIVSLVSEEPDPTAEKVVVSIEGGQVVGKRVGKDKATPLSPQEAEQLWRSVAQPGQQTGDVVVSLSQGQIVGSQQLTPTEAETIKSVVSQETKAVQVMQTSQQVQPGASVTSQQLGVVGTVQTTQGFSTGAPIGGMVASGTFATGTVAPGTVAPGTVAPGTVAPGTVTPGVAPGTVAHGTVAPGTVALGTVALGTIAPGTAASGTVTLGTVAPGTVTVTTGIAEPGTVAPGTGAVVSGTVTDSGSVSIGTTASGQIPEYLPPFARHPLPPIGVGDVPAPTASETPLSPSTTVMASIEGGNIVRARKLNFGKFEDFAPQEAEQMLSGLPERQATQSGNIMVMISEGQIVKSQQLSPWVAEQLIATMSGSAHGQVTVPVSGQATYVPAPGSPPVTVPVYGQAKISPAIVDKPITPVSGEAKFFAGQEADVVKGQGTQLQGTASQQIAGSVITQQATVTVSGLTPGFQAAPFQTTPASTVLPHGFQANIPQVSDETLPVAHITSHVMPTIPETLPNTSERIVASFSDGKIVGAQKIVDGRTVQVEPAYAEATLRTASSQAVPQSGTIMMTVADGRVQETKPLTPAEAQYVAATATVEDAGKAIPYTTPGFQQAVGVQSSQIVPSQPYNYQTPTLSLGQQALQPSEKIMMTIDEGKVVGAVQLKHGESTQIPASEAEKMLAVSGQPGQQSGNVMLTVSEGAVLDTQQVTPREAETIMTTLSAQPDPTAETIIVRFVNGQVVGAERSFQEQTSTLSAPEAQTLLSSVPNQPTPQTGNILLIKSEGRIVESQELTSTEADTIMSTVFHKAQQQSVAQQQPNLTSFTQTQPSFTPAAQSVTPKQDRIVVTVADGKVTGAKDLKTGQQKQLSLMEAQQILGSTPDGTEQQTGNIMVTVTDGRIAESKPVTQKEAETIASVVAEQSDPTAEKVVVSVEGGQVVGKRVVKDKATPISPQEAAQLWRSVAQPGQQTGDVVVSLSQGQIVGSQQLTPMEAETIKAVVVEEPKPIVCLPPVQPTSIYKPAGIPTAEVAAPHKDKIMVTVTDGKVTGAKQIKSGETKELSPLETQQIMASVPVEATQKSGNVMVTVTEGKVVDTKSVTEKEAETIVSLVTEQPDPTAEKVVVSVEGDQVVGKRVGKDKATPLSPQEAAQLWRSVAQPGQQTGDVVVSLSQGQIVGSQQLTPMEAETIKAVVVEEPKPIVCPPSLQPVFTSFVPTPATFISTEPTAAINAVVVEEPKPTVCTFPMPTTQVWPRDPNQPNFASSKQGWPRDPNQPTVTPIIPSDVPTVAKEDKIMVTVTDGKVTGAKQIKSGETKELSPLETQQIMASVPAETAHQSGNIMVTVTDGKVVDTKPVTEKEAETIVSLVTKEPDPTAEKVVVSVEGGQVVGKRVGKDKATPLSPQEAAQLWRSVAQPGQQTGDVVVSLSQGQIVGSQQLTPTEAETIKAVVVEEPRPTVCPTPAQSTYMPTVLPTAKLATPQENKIMVTVTDGKVTGAKQLKSGETKELSPLETQQIMASIPTETAQQSGNIMVTVTEGKVVDTKPVTEKEAETIVSLVTEESDPTAEKVVVSVEGGQVVGKRVGKDKATPLSPQEAAQLWRSVAQPGQQTGDVVVSLSQGQIVGSQQLTPMEAETIKAVVVEEPRPTVCPTPAQSTYMPTVLPTAKLATPQENKIMVTVTDGKVTGAKQLKSGETKELSPLETQQIMASVPTETAQQSGNIMVTVTEGKVVDTKPVTEKEAETIVSLVTEESDPTAEKVVVSVEGGQVVGKRVGKDKATPLSPQEAAQLWRSVAQPGQQTGDVVVSLSQGQIVGSQQLTPMEAETIKAVVVEEPKPIVCPPSVQPVFTSFVPTPTFISTEPTATINAVVVEEPKPVVCPPSVQPGSLYESTVLPTAKLVTPQEDKIMVTVTDGKVTGAKQLKSGQTKELSPLETQQIMASVPAVAAQKSGNIMVTVTAGKVVGTKPVTEKEAETIVSLVTEESDPTAEKVVVSVEGGQVVGKRVGKDKATPLSPQEAAQLWRSVAQPGQQTGDVVVSLSQGQIVGSQQLTQMEAETIKAVVVEEQKPIVCPPLAQPTFMPGILPTAQLATPQEDKIMVTVIDGKVTGAKQLKSGETKELSPLETQQIMASVPAEAAQKSGNIMVTVTEGKVVDTKPVTEKEAETIVSLVTEQPDPTAEKVVVSVEGGQVVGKREAAQLWRSVAQPGQQTGDVVVSLSQGQIVGSQQLTPTEAETIKAVVVEEPKPIVCPPSVQPVFTSFVPTPTFISTEPTATINAVVVEEPKPVVCPPSVQPGSLYESTVLPTAKLATPQEDKIMVTVTDGKVTGAKQLKSGQTKELSPLETQQIMASVPAEAAQKSGNIMVTVTEGKVVGTKPVTEKEAETIVSLVTEESDPTAEKVVVSVEGGQVVGKRVGKDKATPLSPQEAAQLWRSVAQPGQQTGDVVVSLSQGQIVGSQQLTPMEAETIKAVVVEEQKPIVCPPLAQPTFMPGILPTAQLATPQEDKIMVTVTDGKVTGAKQLKSGETKELSPLETQQIMASVPAEAAQNYGKEAETIVSLVTEQPDPTAEKVVVSVEGGQVVGKRVGKDKATPLSPQEAAQLWRSVAQPGQQTGDVVVSLSQGQIVGSQHLTPMEAETIKAVVVEEPKTLPVQPAFASVLPTPSTFDSTEPSATGKPVSSEKIIVNVVDGKVAGAKHLRPGDTKDLSSMEAQQILAYVPVQKPGNVIVTVADGKVVESKRVTEVEAENIMSLVSEEVTPDAEKAIVTLEGGEIVGKRVGKDKTTPLSPQEAEELWRSVARPGQISGDVMVTMSQGKIVKSQQLTPTEAETIKVVVAEEAKPAVTMSSSSPLDRAPGQDIRGSETLMATIVDGKVVGARKLKDGVTTQVSTAEAEDIISSVPGQSSQTGHVLATLAGKEVVEVQQLTPKDAEEINVTGTVPQAIDTTPGEKVLLTVAAGRVAEAQKVGQRKLTPLSPTDGETLLESASSKTKEPGDIAVTIVDGKVVGSRWVSSKVGSTQGDGNVPTGDTAVIRKVVMTPSGEQVVQEVVAAKNVPASEMALSGDYGKRVKVEVLEGRAAMKEFLAGSSTDSDQDAYMTPVSSQSDAYVSASSDAYVTPPSETSDAYVTPPGEPMDYSGPADQQDGKSWFAQVTDKEGDAAQVTEGTMPLESSIERSTSAEDIFVDADQGRPIPTAEMEGDVSEPSRSAGVFKAPRPLQVGQVREEVVIPSALPGREPTETDERQPKQRTVSEVARDVIPPMHVKTGELKTEPQFFRQGEVQEAQIRPEHVGPDEPVKSRRTTSDLAEEIIGPLANSTSPQKGDVFFTEVPEVQQVPKGAQQKMVEEAARQKRTELEYYRHVSQEGEDTEEMTPEILKAAEDDLKKSPRVSFRTGPPEVIGRTDDDDEDRRKPIATITMEKTEKTPIGDVKIAPAAKVAGKEPGKPTWNKVWPEKSDKLPADVTTMETVEVEEYQLAPGVGRAGAVPAFTKKLSTMLAKEGSTFEAAVKVSGDPQPDITWYHHDKPLKPTDKLDIVKDKGYSSLVFMEVLPEHAGLYSCVATNIMGKATSRAPLVITDEMDSELPLPGAVMSDEGELEAEGEDEAPALPPRLQDVDEVPILSGQVQSPLVGDSSSVSSLEPDDITADKKVRDAKSAVVKELKEFQAKSPTFKVGEKAPERVSTSEEEGGTMVTPTVDGEKVSPGKVDITTPVVSVGSKAGVTTPKAGTQAEVTTPTGGVAIEAVRLPHGSAEPAPAETKPAEGEDDVFSPGVTLAADVKPGEGQKTPTPEETILTLKKETKAGAPDVKTRPGDLPVAIGEVVWAEPAKGATPKGSAGRTPSAELRTPSTGGKTPSAEDVASAEKKKTGWSKFKRTFSTKKKKDKKSSSSSSSIDRIPYEKRQAYASGSLPRSTEKYPELSRSTTMPVRPISMVSPGDRPDLSRASLRTSSSTSSASSTKDRKETRPYSYAGRLDFDPRSPGYDQQRPDLPFVEAEVVPAGGTKAVAGVAAVERNGKAEDSDDSDTKVTSSSSVVMSSSTFVTSSTTTTVTVSGEQKAGMVGANLPTSVSAPTGFGAETASGTGPATLTATVSRTSVSTTASRASVALEDSEDSAREATDNFPKYLGGKKKYRKKRGQKQQCKQQ